MASTSLQILIKFANRSTGRERTACRTEARLCQPHSRAQRMNTCISHPPRQTRLQCGSSVIGQSQRQTSTIVTILLQHQPSMRTSSAVTAKRSCSNAKMTASSRLSLNYSRNAPFSSETLRGMSKVRMMCTSSKTWTILKRIRRSMAPITWRMRST